ncbi:uncharacterized protein [Nicotiana sylvestris]|uniref:uncharacterized protein n=1 Tax=Nicotiana sylvestris TaxID=4096 RepID=UPI00388C725A
MAEYEACILRLRLAVDMEVQDVSVLGDSDLLVHQIQGATPYLLVYGTEAVIPAEVEISSLRIVTEAGIDDDEWVKARLEQLNLIDEKRLAAVCHGQLYQKRMARAYNKKVHPRKFEVGQQVLKRILPHQIEAKGKFAPNWQGPYVVTRLLSNDALYLADIEGRCIDMAINSDAIKRYYA